MALVADEQIATFPQDEDLDLMDQATKLRERVSRLSHWMARFAEARQGDPRWELPEPDQLKMLQLMGQARSLYASSRVPVACAFYGPSQVGKSLLIGRVLTPEVPDQPPLGRDEGYAQPISFERDLNPSCAANEATALVTRFTTDDRMRYLNPAPHPHYPVMVRALNRAQWMSVLGRGFQIECRKQVATWNKDTLLERMSELRKEKANATDAWDPAWLDDLLQVYAYMRHNDERTYTATATEFNGALICRPLSHEGCIQLAAVLFWDAWPELTQLFREVLDFLQVLARESPRDDEAAGRLGEETILLTGWGSVRFLLDSARVTAPVGARFKWDDFVLARAKPTEWYTLQVRQDVRSHAGQLLSKDLGIVQAAMLEMVVPVLPDRLTDYWRRVLKKMDLLDVPGMRAGRSGPEQGKREREPGKEVRRDQQFEIVKRGKVAFLFERYTDEKLIQTLLLLARGGLLEVSAYMKAHVNQWGRSRYGDRWPEKVNDDPPPLLIGLTGIDEELERYTAAPQPAIYEQRLRQLASALGPTMEQFGGRKFRNIYLLRYPGTWDADAARREQAGLQKWEQAQQAFLACGLVHDYILTPERKWQAAMTDQDGGVSLVSECIFGCTSSSGKRKQLKQYLEESLRDVALTARSWYFNTETLKDRERRAALACKLLKWLHDDPGQICYRVRALTEALTVREGEILYLADLQEIHAIDYAPGPQALERRVVEAVRNLLSQWALTLAPQRWLDHLDGQRRRFPKLFDGRYAPQSFTDNDFRMLTQYLKDYLSSAAEQPPLLAKLMRIVGLPEMRDASALLQARRRCTRLILNDFILNPGGALGGLPPVEGVELPPEQDAAFGVLNTVVARWRRRLPAALAAGAGADAREPPGNRELETILASLD